MSNLTVFEFESQEVRFVGTSDDPWWVAADVCTVLEHSNPSSAIARLDDDEKKLLDPKQYLGSSSNQDFWAINESGLYSLILTSRKPQAKRFKKWVTSEVLPSIRKTGKYEIPQPTPTPALPPSPKEIVDVINLVLGNLDIHPNLKAGVIANAIAKQHPQFAPTIEAAKSVLPTPIESELVRPTALAKRLAEVTGDRWTAFMVNQLLLNQSFQIKNPKGENPPYLPTEKGKQHGQITFDTARGRDKTVQSLMWHYSVLEALESLEVDDNRG